MSWPRKAALQTRKIVPAASPRRSCPKKAEAQRATRGTRRRAVRSRTGSIPSPKSWAAA
jgi:hypothetical protein